MNKPKKVGRPRGTAKTDSYKDGLLFAWVETTRIREFEQTGTYPSVRWAIAKICDPSNVISGYYEVLGGCNAEYLRNVLWKQNPGFKAIAHSSGLCLIRHNDDPNSLRVRYYDAMRRGSVCSGWKDHFLEFALRQAQVTRVSFEDVRNAFYISTGRNSGSAHAEDDDVNAYSQHLWSEPEDPSDG